MKSSDTPKSRAHSKWRGVVVFTQRHKTLLTVVGSFILVGTFFIREVLREEQKDLRDSVEAAESTFAIRADLGSLADEVFVNQRREDRYRIDPRRNFQGLPEQQLVHLKLIADVFLEQEIDEHALTRIAGNLATTDQLVDRLSGQLRKKEGSSLEQLKKELERLRVDYDGTLKDAGISSSAISTRLSDDTLRRALDRLRALEDGLGKVTANVDNLVKETLKDARAIRDKSETRYSIYTQISIVLYCIGAILGLIGHLFGDQDSPEGG